MIAFTLIGLLFNIISIEPGCTQPTPGATLTGTFDGDTIHLVAEGCTPNTFATFVYSIPLGEPVPFYGGSLCGSWNPIRHTPIGLTDALGGFEFEGELLNIGPGAVRSAQCMYRKPNVGFGGDLSDGVVVTYE